MLEHNTGLTIQTATVHCCVWYIIASYDSWVEVEQVMLSHFEFHELTGEVFFFFSVLIFNLRVLITSANKSEWVIKGYKVSISF